MRRVSFFTLAFLCMSLIAVVAPLVVKIQIGGSPLPSLSASSSTQAVVKTLLYYAIALACLGFVVRSLAWEIRSGRFASEESRTLRLAGAAAEVMIVVRGTAQAQVELRLLGWAHPASADSAPLKTSESMILKATMLIDGEPAAFEELVHSGAIEDEPMYLQVRREGPWELSLILGPALDPRCSDASDAANALLIPECRIIVRTTVAGTQIADPVELRENGDGGSPPRD